MTAYSYNNGAVRATNGFNLADCKDYAPVVTLPPTIEEKWEPFQNPRKMRLLTDTHVVDIATRQPQGNIVPAGTDVALVEKKTTADNKVWARSQWARDNAKDWGLPLDNFGEVPAVTPVPEPPVEPVPEPPLDVDPTVPGNGDSILENTNIIVKILKAIAKFFGIKWE